jgi:hypothetical protein
MAIQTNQLPMGGPLEIIDEDGTLFRAGYDSAAQGYRVESRTPVEGHEPLVLKHFVARKDARIYRDMYLGYSIDTAGLQVGIDYLSVQIPTELRKFKRGIVVERELQSLEGFGSF